MSEIENCYNKKKKHSSVLYINWLRYMIAVTCHSTQLLDICWNDDATATHWLFPWSHHIIMDRWFLTSVELKWRKKIKKINRWENHTCYIDLFFICTCLLNVASQFTSVLPLEFIHRECGHEIYTEIDREITAEATVFNY